jgi:hypothetical protein
LKSLSRLKRGLFRKCGNSRSGRDSLQDYSRPEQKSGKIESKVQYACSADVVSDIMTIVETPVLHRRVFLFRRSRNGLAYATKISGKFAAS